MKNQPTPMKISNRRALMRRLAKRVKARQMSVEQAELLSYTVMSGQAQRQQVYGFHPTRGNFPLYIK